MLEVKNLTVAYGKQEILHGIDLQADKGCVTTLVGKNGCGKSTLLKAIAGVVPSRGGDILIDGCPVSDLSAKELAKKVAYLPQGRNLPEITAGKLVLHGRFPYLKYPRSYSKYDRQIAEQAMEEMSVLSFWDVPISELSGGTRQKVYIAMALAKRSSVILMDEPTTYLDMEQQLRFAQLAKKLARQGKTVLLVLHDLLLALKVSDSICIMEQGKVTASAPAEEIFASNVLTHICNTKISAAETFFGTQYYYDFNI